MNSRSLVIVLMVVSIVAFSGCASGAQTPSSNGTSSGDFPAMLSTEFVEASSESSGENIQLHDDLVCCLVGEISLIKGDEQEFQRPRLWAALVFDKPVCYVSNQDGDYKLDRIQIGPVASDGNDQAAWEPYEGRRVIVAGVVRGATWNFWHLTPCTLEDAVVVDSGEGHRTGSRDEAAMGFAKAIRTNYHVENGEYVHEERDYKQYVSPTSELYAYQDGNDEGEDVLILGNPSRVDSVEVADVVGDTYILDMLVCQPEGSLDDESSRTLSLAVTFNDDDLVGHARFLF